MLKVYQFTHGDLDGVGCAVVAKIHYTDKCIRSFGKFDHVVSYCDYQNIDKRVLECAKTIMAGSKDALKDTILLISDICPQKTTLDELDVAQQAGLNIKLFDHHKTRSYSSNYKWATYDVSTCATTIMWKSWFKEKNKLDDFVASVNAYDMWIVTDQFRKRGENLNLLFNFLGAECFYEAFYKEPWADLTVETNKIISILQDNKEEYVNQLLLNQLNKAQYQTDNNGHLYKILVASKFSADIGHKVLSDQDHANLHYVIVANPEYGTCSLYSRDTEIDVSVIAKKLNGGGHTNAAGFPYNLLDRLSNGIKTLLDTI